MNKDTIASVLLGLAAFALVGVIWPMYQEYQDTQTMLDERETLLVAKQRGAQALQALEQQYTQRLQDARDLNVLLPDGEQVEYIITSIDAASRQSGMRLNTVDVAEPKSDTSAYDTVNIQVSLEGSYRGLLVLLETLERSLRIYDVIDISISPERESNTLLSIQMSLRTYTIPQ